MNEAITASVLGALNILVMERLGEGSFRIAGNAPRWFAGFDAEGHSKQDEMNPGDIFPFLESFLFDAEDFWQQSGSGRMKSGPWIEVDPESGNEIHLEATAVSLGESKALLVQLLGAEYEEKQTLLQKLRDNRLDHTRLVKEIRAEVLAGTKSIDLIGQLLGGKYELRKVIGQGGLGVVYQGIDVATQQKVAVKLLREDGNDQNAGFSQQLFEREIKILKRVSHPNIVGIIDSGVSATGRLYLVMDYIDGQSLDDIINFEGVWTVKRTQRLLKQICPALQTMHEQNIIHRDLKPPNIMIRGMDDSEEAILLDLGIAKVMRGSTDSSLIRKITQTGVIMGTVQYLSPEQCTDSELDQRTDVYALGIIVFELLTGTTPFHADSVQGWLLAHLQAKPLPLTRLNPFFPQELEDAVLSTLAKRKEDRPLTTMEFLERFEKAAEKVK